MSIYFFSDLEGRFTRKRDFTWRVSDCDDYRVLSEDDSYPKLSQRNSGVYDTASFLFFSYRPPGKSEG